MLSGWSNLAEPRTLEQALADLLAKYRRQPSSDLERTIKLIRAEIELREWKRPGNLYSAPANTNDQRADVGSPLPLPERTARSVLARRHTWFARGYSTSSPRAGFVEARPALRDNLRAYTSRLTRSALSHIEITGRREECSLQIILVDWLIIKGAEPDFKKYWKEAVPVEDRSLMVGEFLSEPDGHEKFPWVTEDLRSGNASRFINVGLWASAEAFHKQIARYFDPAAGKLSFEFELRRRALLTPACWRMGDWPLPIHDSGGVL
jgi:hypothetical protein